MLYEVITRTVRLFAAAMSTTRPWCRTRIDPASGRTLAYIARSRVDLPAPEGPCSTTHSPAATERSRITSYNVCYTKLLRKTGFEPFLKDMEKILGVKVKPFFAPDYAGIIEGMRFNKVDIAWFGNKSAMEAVDRAGGEIFAQTVDVTRTPGSSSLLLVNKDSPLTSLV